MTIATNTMNSTYDISTSGTGAGNYVTIDSSAITGDIVWNDSHDLDDNDNFQAFSKLMSRISSRFPVNISYSETLSEWTVMAGGYKQTGRSLPMVLEDLLDVLLDNVK